MKIILNGVSSSGKTSIVKLLPSKYKVLSMDIYFDEIFCYHNIKPPQSLYKNQYYSAKQTMDIDRLHLWDFFTTNTHNVKDFIIDTVDVDTQLGLSKHLKKHNIKNVKNVLLYTNISDLTRNIVKRKDFEPRDVYIFTEQFVKMYVYTKNKDEAIDTVNLKKCIQDLKRMKYEFPNETKLIKFAKEIFKKLKIKNVQPNKHYYIKPTCKYDLVLKTSGKSSKEILNKLLSLEQS
jgi:hypothetical protein